MPTQPALRATPADHVHVGVENCPYCEQPVPNDRADEIRARFDADQRRQAAVLKERMDVELASALAKAEEAQKAEVARISLEHARALENQKAEALAQQIAAREEGKKSADNALVQRIEQLAAEQAAAKTNAEEAERQRLAAVNELATVKAQQEQAIAARVAEARTALEKDKLEELNAVRAQHAEEAQRLSAQVAALQSRIDTEEGEGADVKLIDVLKKAFPKDEFRSVNKTAGADLVHVIKHKGKACGKIVYDTRNRNAWNPKFAADLRSDMVIDKADHAILTTSKFPSGSKQVCHCDGVLVANPARVLVLAEIFRAEVIRSHGQRISAEDRDRKTEKLYTYIASDSFDKLLDSMNSNDVKLLKLEEEEMDAHKAIWRKRGSLLTNSQKLHARLRESIDGIIDASEVE